MQNITAVMQALKEAELNTNSIIANNIGVSTEALSLVISLLMIWSLTWKALALWKAVKKNSIIWFIALLIINDLGILEILYLYVFSKFNYKQKQLTKAQKNKIKKARAKIPRL